MLYHLKLRTVLLSVYQNLTPTKVEPAQSNRHQSVENSQNILLTFYVFDSNSNKASLKCFGILYQHLLVNTEVEMIQYTSVLFLLKQILLNWPHYETKNKQKLLFFNDAHIKTHQRFKKIKTEA